MNEEPHTATAVSDPSAGAGAGASGAIVCVDNLSKRFGSFVALNEVSLEIFPGEVFGLLGPNGAGKSTLIRTLMGFLKPTHGSATIAGLDCCRQRVHVHQQVTYLPGDAKLYGLMRAKFLLKQFSGLRENASYERALEIADRLELDLNRWVGLMSTGMRQKLALAVCLSVDCPVIILDESTANLDPTIRSRVLDMVVEAKSRGRTVVFSSHVMSEVESVCDRVGILKRGKLVCLESLAELNRIHRIDLRIDGDLPPPPESLKNHLSIENKRGLYSIETTENVPEVLRWISDLPIEDVHIQPIGLRSIFEKFHA